MDGSGWMSTAPPHPPGLAVFDLDYTLTRRGTWGRFIWQWVKFRPHVWLPLLLTAGWTQLAYKRGKCPRVDVKLSMMRWAMKDAPRGRVKQRGYDFAQKELRTGLRPGALKLIEFHKSRKDKLIIISAAVDVIAKPMGEALGFDYVLSTEMDYDNCNKLKLNFKTPNCYSHEKVNRFNRLISENLILKQYHTKVTFYSDSISDLAMFNAAHICVPVNPDKKLSRYALDQGWTIQMW